MTAPPPPALPRRRVLRLGLLGLAGGVAGCGFRPLYGSGGAVGSTPEMAAIYVPVLPERSGQLMRQALQRRLEGDGGVAKKYELSASFALAAEGLGIQTDNSTTRLRYVATSTWVLRDMTPKQTVLAGGTARALDGLNIFNQQYFAADLETETVTRRLAELIADQVVQQVATHFRRRDTAA